MLICIAKNTDMTVGISTKYNLIICGLKATSRVSVFNKHAGDSHQERCDRGLKYSVGATQAEKNEGNYLFVPSLECSVSPCAHVDGITHHEPIVSSRTQGRNSQFWNTRVRMQSFFIWIFLNQCKILVEFLGGMEETGGLQKRFQFLEQDHQSSPAKSLESSNEIKTLRAAIGKNYK